MKLAFVIYDLNRGGAERVVSILSQELSKKHDISLIIFNNRIKYDFGGKIIDLDCGSVSSIKGKIINIFKRAYRLREVFKRESFDKIYAFMETAYMPSILTGYSVIASVRNNPTAYTTFVTKYILNRAGKVVAVSKEIEEILNHKFNINQTITIKNPIDFDFINKMKNHKIDEKNFIMAMGRLHPQKGFDILIEAYSKSIIKEYYRLFIFGEGKQRELLEKQIKKSELTDKVVLKGLIDNPYKYLGRAEIFILSSRYEGFPNVLIEALACNASVISTNCPTGPSEIIEDEVNGLLIKSESIEELTKALDRLYLDKEVGIKNRLEAKKSIEYLSVDNIANEWLSL